MILVDTGPLVALFDVQDADHRDCRQRLRALRARLLTTLPVLTEAFHLLSARSGERLRHWLEQGGAETHFACAAEQTRSFELMDRYKDTPMDFADASLIAAAEALQTLRVFTLDGDFVTYRIRRGHRHYAVEIV